MPRIVFIRHARPQIDEGIPSAQWRLSDEGRQAAGALAEHFRSYAFAGIGSSPEPKAVGTAEACGSRLGVAVEIDPGFAEHARRSVGFLSREDLDASIARLFAEPGALVFGDETADQAYERFCDALARQTAKAARDVMVVTHGTILTVYLSRVANIDPMPFWRRLATPAAVILEGGRMSVLDVPPPGPKFAPFPP